MRFQLPTYSVLQLQKQCLRKNVVLLNFCLPIANFTALCRSFLKRCTMANKAIGTKWRDLSNPPQRRQGPDLCPLWLVVGTPSAVGPELAYSLHVAQPTLMDVPIFCWYTLILLYMFVYHIFMTALVGCWSSIRRIIYTFLNVCPFDYMAVAVSGTCFTTLVGWLLLLIWTS